MVRRNGKHAADSPRQPTQYTGRGARSQPNQPPGRAGSRRLAQLRLQARSWRQLTILLNRYEATGGVSRPPLLGVGGLMSSVDLVLLAAAATALAIAAVCAVRGMRAAAALRAQQAMLRGALDVAGAEAIEGVVEALIAARRQVAGVSALAPAVEELAERHARLLDAVNARDSVGVSAQDALKTAIAA